MRVRPDLRAGDRQLILQRLNAVGERIEEALRSKGSHLLAVTTTSASSRPVRPMMSLSSLKSQVFEAPITEELERLFDQQGRLVG